MSNLYKTKCPRCGHEWMTNSVHSPCNECRITELFVQLPPHVIAAADQQIFSGRMLNAIKICKESVDIGLHEAKELCDWRCGYLKKRFPGKFGDQQ